MEYKVNTIGWWLSRIEDVEVREKAIKNTPAINIDRPSHSIEYALYHAFIWIQTLEGGEYWKGVYYRYI